MNEAVFKQLPAPLLADIYNSDAVVLEGFEMVGKSYLLNVIKEKYEEFKQPVLAYRPDWEGSLNDKVISRGNRYIPGIVLFDVWKNLHSINKPKLLLDRWLASTYVYSIMYDQEQDCKYISDMIKGHESAVGDNMRLIFIYKCHKTRGDASKFYDMAIRDAEHSDKYDKFEDFNDYYRNYEKADALYRNFFKSMCKFKVYCINSIDNELIEEFN